MLLLDHSSHESPTNGRTDKNILYKYNPGMAFPWSYEPDTRTAEEKEARLQQLDVCSICGPLFRYSYADKTTFEGCRAGFVQEKYLVERWLKDNHNRKCKILNGDMPHHKGNGAPKGAFAFTLTKSPKDPLTVGDMLIAVRKIMKQKSCPVVKYAWYYEDKGRDENGDAIHPHIHGMYETTTGGRIERKHWKRAWDIWDESKPMGAGFRGGYHRPVKLDEAYDVYIKKDGGMSEQNNI